MSRAVSGRSSAIRNATSESCRISLSVSCDIGFRAYRLGNGQKALNQPNSVSYLARMCLGGDLGAVEVLVGRAIVPIRQRGALARLALARRRMAVRDTA